jgi:hypothetical protein
MKLEGGEEYPAYDKGRRANWIGHILSRNCLLKTRYCGKIKRKSEGKTRNKK